MSALYLALCFHGGREERKAWRRVTSESTLPAPGTLGSMASTCSAGSEIGGRHGSRGLECNTEKALRTWSQSLWGTSRLSPCCLVGADLGRSVLLSPLHLLPKAKRREGESAQVPGSFFLRALSLLVGTERDTSFLKCHSVRSGAYAFRIKSPTPTIRTGHTGLMPLELAGY